PVRELLAWLLGLLPVFELPFAVPGWVVDVLIAVIVVGAVFAATRRGLQERRKKLAETRTRREHVDGETERGADSETSGRPGWRAARPAGQEGDGPEPGSSRIRSGRAGGRGPGTRAWVPCARRRAWSTLWVRQTYQVRATIASSTAIAAQKRASWVSASVMRSENTKISTISSVSARTAAIFCRRCSGAVLMSLSRIST